MYQLIQTAQSSFAGRAACRLSTAGRTHLGSRCRQRGALRSAPISSPRAASISERTSLQAAASAPEILASAASTALTKASTAAPAVVRIWGVAAAAHAAELAAADAADIAAPVTSAATIASTDESPAAPAASRAAELRVRFGSSADTLAIASARKILPVSKANSCCRVGSSPFRAIRTARGATRSAARVATATTTSRLCPPIHASSEALFVAMSGFPDSVVMAGSVAPQASARAIVSQGGLPFSPCRRRWRAKPAGCPASPRGGPAHDRRNRRRRASRSGLRVRRSTTLLGLGVEPSMSPAKWTTASHCSICSCSMRRVSPPCA